MSLWSRVKRLIYSKLAAFFSCRLQNLATPPMVSMGEFSSASTMEEVSPKDMWLQLNEEIFQGLDHFLTHGEFDAAMRMQIVYEVLAYNLGMMDGMACLAGITNDVRMESRFHWIQYGKQIAYNTHMEKCSHCVRGNVLWLELHPN